MKKTFNTFFKKVYFEKFNKKRWRGEEVKLKYFARSFQINALFFHLDGSFSKNVFLSLVSFSSTGNCKKKNEKKNIF